MVISLSALINSVNPTATTINVELSEKFMKSVDIKSCSRTVGKDLEKSVRYNGG